MGRVERRNSGRTSLAILALVAGLCTGCYHGLHKTASISVLIIQADEGPVPCTLDLVPAEAGARWQIDPPPQLRSRGMAMWFPEMGYFESWPTHFIATVTCEGYEPWRSRVESTSGFRPVISIEAHVRKPVGV
jgi:hypothetical protein